MRKTVGLIAGDGKLPLLVASGIRGRGHRAAVIGHRGATLEEIGERADVVHWVNVGELERIIGLLKEEGAGRAVFSGAIPKTLFFSGIQPDARAIRVLSRLPDRKDDAILRAVAREIEGEGIRVVSPVPFLGPAMAEKGCWTERRPTEREEKDIAFGWKVAKRIGRLDIGQCVVVKDQMVLAVESIEGTDAAIRRGGLLGKGGVVAVKVCKPTQDRRLDLPVIGPATLAVLEEAGASALAVEAGKTIVVEKEEVVRRAGQRGICLIGL